jgi:hypothetical protein
MSRRVQNVDDVFALNDKAVQNMLREHIYGGRLRAEFIFDTHRLS